MIRIRKVFTALLVFAMVMILIPWANNTSRAQAAEPSGNVTWQELDDDTSTDLSGCYRLERDLDIWHGWMPKEYRIVDDTYIDLNSHFCHGGGNGTLFKVSAGKKLTVHGTGWSYRSGWIKGFYRMFDLEPGATLVLDDLELSWAGGQAINGTGDNITIRLDNASIVEMYTRDDDDAAIKVKGNGLNITGSGRSRVGRSHAGAIYKSAIRVEGNDAVIRNLDIDKNTSRQDEGAGIRLKGDRCLIENCRFRDNTVETRGGAICIYGNDANIKDCTFSNNSAYDSDSSKPKDAYGNTNVNKWISGEDSDSDYSGDSGGAVFIKGNNARLENLKADSSCSKSNGGTFHVWGDGSLVTGVTIERSKSYGGGGAITLKGNNNTVDGADLSRCMTGYEGGGGIHITGSGSTIRNVTISEGISRGDGGGIYIKGDRADVQNVKLRNCRAVGRGGGIALKGQDSSVKDTDVGMCKAHTGKGGGLYLEGSGQSVTGSSFYKNQSAKDQGGAVYIADNNVSVEDCTFRGNEAGFIEDMVSDVSEDPAFTPVSQKISKLDKADMYHGGAIYSDGADTKVIRSGFSENCGRDGGAVYFNRKKASVSDSTFENNAAQRDGGAIDFDAGDTLTDICIFRNNTALRYGGAIYYDSSNNLLRGGQAGTFIEGNKADNARNYGHGVFVDDTDITLNGKLVIRNNNNLDTGTIADVTNDKIPTWSNLCLYKGTTLSVPADGLNSGSEVWIDSDWGHYKKPEGGYIYRGSDSWSLKAEHFRSDRAGYHFIGKNDTLYYTAGDENPDFGYMPAPRVSVEPKSGTWRKSPGRVYIDIDYNMAQADIHKHFNVKVSIDGHYPRPVEVKQTPEGRDYVELTGEQDHTYDYFFDMSYTATLPSPSGGRVSKTSESSTAEYIIEMQMMLSRVLIQSSEEESGEPVTEDLGLGREGDAFEYFGLKHPVLNEGQVLTGWKLLVDGEENERDIDVEWDQEANGIRLVLPDDLDGRDIMLLPQRENKLCRVTYAMSPADFRGLDLPDNTWADHGDELTVKPLGDNNGRRSIGSQVNGVTTWGREPYTVTVTGDTEVVYYVTDRRAKQLEHVAGTAPGCETPGMAEHYVDTETGLLYEDENGGIQISREALVIPPAGHTEGGMTKRVKKTASCLEDGIYNAEVRCETCGELLKEELRTAPATGHDWGEWEEHKTPGCTEKGEEKRVCRYDETHFEIRETSAAGHVWGEWTETKAATDDDEGEEMRICKTDPEHTETRIIPVTGHDHGLVKVEAVAAECEKEGNTEYWICSEGERPCGHIFADPEGKTELDTEDTVTFAQHSPGEAVREFELAADCEEEGYYDEVVYCGHCGRELSRESKTIPATSHSRDDGKVITEPSCNGRGKKTFTCMNDQMHIMTEFTDALGHDWGKWNVIRILAETEEAEEERICKHDGTHKEKRIIPLDDVDRGGDAQNDDYEKQGDDTNNGKEQEVPEREENAGAASDVRKVITDDRSVGRAATGSTVSVTKTTGAPTDDRSNLYIWITIGAAAAATGLAATGVYVKKRKK